MPWTEAACWDEAGGVEKGLQHAVSVQHLEGLLLLLYVSKNLFTRDSREKGPESFRKDYDIHQHLSA